MSDCPACLGVPGYDIHICGKGGFIPEPRADEDAWNGSTSAEQQLLNKEIDSLRAIAKEANDLAVLKAENANLKTVMIAAAEEISAHWDAHCDAEGYGPQNLLHRLEKGIPSEYGYTAGAFTTLQSDLAALKESRDREAVAYDKLNEAFLDLNLDLAAAREEIARARAELISMWAYYSPHLYCSDEERTLKADARYAREIAKVCTYPDCSCCYDMGVDNKCWQGYAMPVIAHKGEEG
jgi:hypothetical protein